MPSIQGSPNSDVTTGSWSLIGSKVAKKSPRVVAMISASGNWERRIRYHWRINWRKKQPIRRVDWTPKTLKSTPPKGSLPNLCLIFHSFQQRQLQTGVQQNLSWSSRGKTGIDRKNLFLMNLNFSWHWRHFCSQMWTVNAWISLARHQLPEHWMEVLRCRSWRRSTVRQGAVDPPEPHSCPCWHRQGSLGWSLVCWGIQLQCSEIFTKFDFWFVFSSTF